MAKSKSKNSKSDKSLSKGKQQNRSVAWTCTCRQNRVFDVFREETKVSFGSTPVTKKLEK